MWLNICGGEIGNCVAYDALQLRNRYMFTAGVMAFGLIADLAVCYESKDLIIFREDRSEELKSRKQGLREPSTLLPDNVC